MVENTQWSHTLTIPEEFLYSLRILGMPPHKLNLKVSAPIILLRNINGKWSVNGTRLQVRHMHDHYIEAKMLTGILNDKHVHPIDLTQLWPSV
ncbi:Helitron helicase [Phytophthora megakarya]|uniref:Helitron helicase n=1 Tax=Phytophthora megakarya TaxID=4795 RepID=A0A225WPN4_9STRA|nr:Helitron helicase [Phytophthora megakarya]